MLDFNGIDICLGYGVSFSAQSEETPEYLAFIKPLREGKVSRLAAPPYLRRFRRVRNRNCPKCGGTLKPISKKVIGSIQQITNLTLATDIGAKK